MPRKSRWKVVPKADRTYKGKVYRSGYECGIARAADEASQPLEYEAETLWFTVPKFTRVDWRIPTSSGSFIYVESKGAFPAEARSRIERIVECNPEVDYRMLFQPGSEGEKKGVPLCKKLGVKHAVGWAIPSEWFNE